MVSFGAMVNVPLERVVEIVVESRFSLSEVGSVAEGLNLGGEWPPVVALPAEMGVGRCGVPKGRRLAGKAAAAEMGAGRRRDGMSRRCADVKSYYSKKHSLMCNREAQMC